MLKKVQTSKKWMISILMVLLMVISGFVSMAVTAQDPNNEGDGNGGENNEARYGILVGLVINPDNEPLVGAVAVLSCAAEHDSGSQCEYKSETGERGYFEFVELHEGLYGLKVYMEGYHDWFEEVKIPAGETIKLRIMLKPIEVDEPEEPKDPEENPEVSYGVVFGFVYNALEEEPIPGAFIVIINQQREDHKLETKTDESGHFKLRIPQGKYVIVVEARGFYPYREMFGVRGGGEVELKIGLKPRDGEGEENRDLPRLCGTIFDAVTDKPIFGWGDLPGES